MRHPDRARALAIGGVLALALVGCGRAADPLPPPSATSAAGTASPGSTLLPAALPAAPTGTLYVARATIDYDSEAGAGEPSTRVFAADGEVDFDTRTGTMRSTDATTGDWAPTGRITLGPRVFTSGTFLGLPYPVTTTASAEQSAEEYDAARGLLEWDVATGLQEMGFTAAPVPSGQRWVSYLVGPDGGSAGDGEEEYTQSRTLDVAPDGAWTYTTVTYYEGDHIAINRVLLDTARAVEPPVDAVKDLLRADPRYAETSTS